MSRYSQSFHCHWEGWLHLVSWTGATKAKVTVIRETPKRYEILNEGETIHIAGSRRILRRGESTLVPKGAITKWEE